MLTYRATKLAIVLGAALTGALATPTTSEAGCCLFDWLHGGWGCCRPPVVSCYQPCCPSPCACPSPCGCPTGGCGVGGCATGQCGVNYGPGDVDYGYSPSPSPCASGNCSASYNPPARGFITPWVMAPLRPTPIVVTPAIQSRPKYVPTPADGPVAKRAPSNPVVRTVSAVRERAQGEVKAQPKKNSGWTPVSATVTR